MNEMPDKTKKVKNKPTKCTFVFKNYTNIADYRKFIETVKEMIVEDIKRG
ncbi:hypothetical protein [Paenibacillus alkalitolerans]|nr:hypothetical protein [Paenibacillus alkalitolerans]